MSDDWLEAIVVEGGRPRVVDPSALLCEPDDVQEVTISYAETHFDGFRFKGVGWYVYADMAILVSPCPRSSGAGDQHFLFTKYSGSEAIYAARWAAQAPIHYPSCGVASAADTSAEALAGPIEVPPESTQRIRVHEAR